MEYSFKTICLNAKEIDLSDLLEAKFKPENDFEFYLCDFLKKFLQGEQNFEQKTSGSTGNPKIFKLQRAQLIASARATLNHLGVPEQEKALVCLSPEYIAGKMMLVRALVGNLKIIAQDPDQNPLTNFSAKEDISLVAVVPYQMRAMLSSETLAYTKAIKHILIGGAPVAKDLEEELIRENISAYETFGMTETISHIALRKAGEKFFIALPGIRLSIDDRSCLCVQSNYLGESKIISNDVVELVSENSFKWLGRWDNVINSGGIKIFPEQLEPVINNTLKKMGIKSRLYLKGEKHARLGQELVLVLENEPLPIDLETKILASLKAGLAEFHNPKRIVYKSEFHETPTGKVIRQ